MPSDLDRLALRLVLTLAEIALEFDCCGPSHEFAKKQIVCIIQIKEPWVKNGGSMGPSARGGRGQGPAASPTPPVEN